MSLEWARARARENAARLASQAELQAHSQVVQRPLGPLLSWRPSCAQPGRSAAENLLCARPGGPSPQGIDPGCGQALPEPHAIAPERPRPGATGGWRGRAANEPALSIRKPEAIAGGAGTALKRQRPRDAGDV
jgi:hypothetical protein